jgi:SAM-dependent methyltransferase
MELYQRHHRAGARYGYLYGGEERARQFRDWVGSGKRVLDLGCRDGTLAAHLTEGNRVVGVDIDPAALRAAGQRLAMRVVQGDLNDFLPFAPGSFDAVVAGELLEHVYFPAIFLGEIARVLRPGGRFVGSTPNAFRLRNRWRFLRGQEFETDETHVHRFSCERLARELLRHFLQVRIEPTGGHFLGGGRSGIPVSPRAPVWARRLFALDLCWLAEDPIPGT